MRFCIGRRVRAGVAALSMGVAFAAVSTLAAPAAHATASSIGVYVGYADVLHASATNFPTPWSGDSGVTFDGCTSCSYDAGAVRVVNTGSSSLSIDKVKVHVDTCTYDLWASHALAPGAQLVITQTVDGADNGCSANGHMDTSDVGPGGVGYSGNCTPDGIIPTVDVTISGTTSSFSDTGQVINTGGVDGASCPHGSIPAGNESSQWSLIGTAACPGSSLTLSPSSQAVQTGTQATVQATLTNSCGTALSGVTVTFLVVGEGAPNAGTTGSGVTDASGHVSFSYLGSLIGTDGVQASVTNTAGTLFSNTVTVLWANGAANCQPNKSCTATATVPNSQTSKITGTSSTGGQITENFGQDTLTCGDPFSHAPAVTTFVTSGGFTGTGPKTVVLTIAKAAVAGRDKNSFEICFSSNSPFTDQFGNQNVTTGILPSCRKVGNVAPCEVSTKAKRGAVIETFIVTAADPKFW